MPSATTLRVVDSSSGTELLNLTPWTSTILNSVDLGYPNVRTVSVPISGAHGVSDTTRWFADRAITVEVTLPEGQNADTALDTLSALLNPGARYYLYVQRPGWTSERRTVVRAGTFTCAPGVMRQAQIGWVAPKGLFEDSVESSVTLQPTTSDPGGGVAFPLSLPATFSAGLAPGAAYVTVDGNTVTPPTIDIYGPCSDPLIRCVTTGAEVSFTGFSIAAGDYLHVDMDARTVTLNSDPNQSRYNRRDLSTSSWWTLPEGTSQVVFSANSPSAPCQAVLRWRPRFI